MRKYVLIILLLCSGCSFTMPVVGGKLQDEIDYESLEKLSNKSVMWGLGKNVNEYKQPIDALNANDLYHEQDAYFIGDNEKKIYLTFDNGYENGYTEKVLDILKEQDVLGTFFLTYDYVKENSDLTRRMIVEGHLIGNHTYKHKSFIEHSLEVIKEDVELFEEYMLKEYYCRLQYLRPPKGEFAEQSLGLMKQMGLKTVLWSFAYYDYNVNDQMDHDTALTKLKDALHPGAIYLLHCVSKTNSEVLKEFIVYAKDKGYTFSLIDF